MPTVLDLVRQEALPYLQRYGNPEGFLDLCRQRNREHPAGGHYEILRQQAATEALLGDNHAALESIDQLIRVMAKLMTESPLPWMSEVLTDAQALRAQLTGKSAAVQPSLAQIEAQRRSALKLPPPSKPQQGG